MKKVISFAILLFMLFFSSQVFYIKNLRASCVYSSDNYFVVTAYYSPLPNQEYYFKGSYEADKKLNGNGVTGASGKDVFIGMLAAPKNYVFGTKIYLEGVGVGEVADRGGAIVSTDPSESRGYEYDRIDVWMGYGEEGLARALAWGKKTVKGYMLADSATNTTVSLSNFPAPKSVLEKYAKKQEIKKEIIQELEESNSELDIFNKYVGPESSEEKIKELQEIFFEMGFYDGEIDGKYDNIKNDLINYQLNTGIIKSKTNIGAGYFGPKTSAQAKKDYLNYLEEEDKKQHEEEKIKMKLALIEKTVIKHIESIGNPEKGDIGRNVRVLQKTLKTLGYFDVKDSAIFGDITEISIIDYQIDKGIILSKDDEGAGYFGPKTKETLKEELITILEKQYLKQDKLLSYKK